MTRRCHGLGLHFALITTSLKRFAGQRRPMSKKTVLLVEDDAGDRNMYGNILWYNGYDVVFAEDGEAGLRIAAAEKPDLIILDLQLPLLHGSELASRLKQENDT
ncbi:MAG TPA: response regulator, partial [Longimicrobiales bacterium]